MCKIPRADPFALLLSNEPKNILPYVDVVRKQLDISPARKVRPIIPMIFNRLQLRTQREPNHPLQLIRC